jgi:hypothetical protein
MWLRRAFYRWLLPAAFLLPLWLFVGWGVFQAGGWAFLWVLFIAVPSVFVGQLALTLITRSRPSVKALRAVSWGDVLGYTVWHGLTIALGFYVAAWWAPVMVLTVIAGIALVWFQLQQLWREARPADIVLRAANGAAYIPPAATRTRMPDSAEHEVIVVEESAHREP